MMINHAAFGLRVSSTVRIPGLRVIDSADAAPADLHVWVRQRPHVSRDDQMLFSGVDRRKSGVPRVEVSWLPENSLYCFRYRDGTLFYIHRSGREIWADWCDPYTAEDMATYLLGPVFGFILRLQGVTPLHASAVCVAGGAITLLGNAQSGKSTTAAAFSVAGFTVLTDDVAAIDECETAFYVRAGYPHLRLWPKSVEMLFGSREALKPITPNWNKRDLPLSDGTGSQYQAESLPLAAVYVLAARRADDRAPYVETMTPRECFMTLLVNTYVNYALDEQMRKAEFDLIGRLVASVPIRRVVPHADPGKVWQLRDAILADFGQAGRY